MHLASRAAPVVLAVSLVTACAGAREAGRDPPQSLTVRELTVVDARGQPRLRIGAPLPPPKGAERRAVDAFGIQFMDQDGYEVAGLGMLEPVDIRGLCFDIKDAYEAMCVGLVKGEPSITFRHDWKERITLGVEKGVASIVLRDAQGEPRVRLEVDPDGKTRVEGVAPTAPARP
ncbi:conserved hypothetical protein [Anaeromyxobacter dehalogenans 2CP-1]|uniref:Lipoprotein n=1 Tax=Anaeromyxobacter dehalogenans (strain ATCC BAA-258 / DSM 21875 / 2CP-1) TaxID=455488 RepID=B8J7Q9_ANAD2|nr:hypothetical protein [Anaeromyxobacter dehalogenans]ACL63401.1 conserved hypothetical protein [Anaeromyxobacter dehalogenans 2CP-1]